MTIDEVLHALAFTPAVLPVIVLVWYRTRQELRGIRKELARRATYRNVPGLTS